MWEQQPPHQPTDLHRHHHHHHHHHRTSDRSSYPPQFHHTPHHHPPNYPNFYPNLPPPPPPPQTVPDSRLLPPPTPLSPDFRLPPPPPLPPNFRSPNCAPPILDPVDFRVSSWPDHRSLHSNDFRFNGGGRDAWELSPSFSRGSVCEFRPASSPRPEVGDYMRHQFAGMDIDRRGRYDSAGRSSGYGGFVQKSTSPTPFFQDDVVHRGWGSKRQRYEDVPRSLSFVRHREFEPTSEGFVVPRSDGNIQRKVQRKSALLRIADSSAHNNYPCKNLKSSGHCSSSKTSPFKVKYSSPAKRRIKKEGENSPRKHNPIHVSFKSNSLVAKQIVAPLSPVDITNNGGTPRSRKFSKLTAPDVDDFNVASREVKQSPLKRRVSGHSPQNPVHPEKINELPQGSDCGAVNKNLLDIWASPVGQIDKYDKVLLVDDYNSSGGKYLSKRGKRKKQSEFRLPISMQPLEDPIRSFSPTKIMSYKDSKERFRLLPASSTETSPLVISVDDNRHHLLPQHIGEATTESFMKQCGCKQSDNQDSQLSSDCCCKETMTDIPAARVNEIDCSEAEHPQDKCIQLSPLKADLLGNTIIDQTCPEGTIEKGILEEHTMTLTVDDNNKVGQDIGIRLTNMKKRKERNTQFDFTDSIPAARSHENDIFNKVTVDSDKGCVSPDPVGVEKEVTRVMDKGLVPLDASYTNIDVTTTASEEAAPHSVCDDWSNLVPVSSRSVALHKDGFNSSNLAQGTSRTASDIEIAISTMKTDSDPDVRSTIASLERMPEGKTTNVYTRFDKNSTDVALGNDNKGVVNSVAKTNLGHAMQVDTLPSVSCDIDSLKSSRATLGRLTYQKRHALHAPFRTSSSSMCFASPKVESSSKMHPIKSRTWHRSDNGSTAPLSVKTSGPNSVPPRNHMLKSGQPQGTSYIRKGNSLVRNPSPVVTVFKSPQVSTYPTPQAPVVDDKKGFTENKDDLTIGHNRCGSSDHLHNIQNYEGTQSLEKSLSNSSDTCPVKSPDTSPMRPLVNCGSESDSAPLRSPDGTGLVQLHDEMKLKETIENHSMLINSLGTQAAVNNGSCISSNSDCILHSEHDSCQLISTPGPVHLTVENTQNNKILSSESYYKTRMNQIIRTPSDSTHPLPLSSCNLNTEGKHAQNMVNRTCALQSYKGTMHKPSNSSLVWTLQGAQPISKLIQGHFQCKRPTSWRDMRNSGASLNSRASLMLRKLTLYRNQNTLYKRSTHGLSLRKYKVVALGGCSLKWSKSIERRSKKASEDATRAVVAAKSIKRVQSRPHNTMFREETKHHTSSKSAQCVTPHPRGRIFRVGSVRYRMDPSGKTLRRIIGDVGSAHGDLEDKDSKRAYIPMRLAIGKNEYIRIGNGNQLIRDPKKRIRRLANEKIRWSLHNVRQRSMKKSRFCQFYTRFGKCNKDDGKCPFIHDPSKIAVCTKFLKGICSEPNCKLTHKVIPERMEDCSYFLQGMCSNESCPYRHVNVNPNATTCEGFLRGYCADGDECKKKHSYVCHVYEETGSCPEGSKCRLHHPKKQKAKQTGSRFQNFSKGRYFGHPAPEFSDPQTVVPLKPLSGSSDKDGDIPDFISIDDEDDVVNVTVNSSSKHDDSVTDIEMCDLNTLIKPIRIMDKVFGDIKGGQ